MTPHLVTARWTNDPWFPRSLHASLLIQVTTEEGLEGWGEATVGYFAPEVAAKIVEYFRPVLVGQNAMEVARLDALMLSDAMWWARGGAGRSVISGIEMALWDLKGKRVGLPVCDLLGGPVRERVPVYASGGPSVWPIEENVRKIAHYRELGHTAAKLSTHLYAWDEDDVAGGQQRLRPLPLPHADQLRKLADLLALLRKNFGGAMDLAVDGHQGGVPLPINVTEAIATAQVLEPFRLRFYEEPLSYRDLDGYAALAARATTPIAGGESLCGVDGFHPLLSRSGLHLVQPDVGFVGGIGETLRLIHHGAGFGAAAALHTGASIGPCFAASWHVAAASTDVAWLECVEASRDVRQEFLADAFAVHEGGAPPPQAPGLGLQITPELLRRYVYVPESGERT